MQRMVAALEGGDQGKGARAVVGGESGGGCRRAQARWRSVEGRWGGQSQVVRWLLCAQLRCDEGTIAVCALSAGVVHLRGLSQNAGEGAEVEGGMTAEDG
jgi:hypothetical protein